MTAMLKVSRLGSRPWPITGANSMDDPLLGQTVAHYRIDHFLGAGGMGKVYQGVDLNMGERLVAIKLLHQHLASSEQLQRRFENEAIVLGKLNHPNIVTVHAFDVEHLMIVMEYIEGSPLDDLIGTRTGPLVFDRLWLLLDPVLMAMDYAHRQGVIHRDMKPSNILVSAIDNQLIPKVMDFGIAKILGQGSGMTATGSSLGTMQYCAPEQIKNITTIDHRADIYALGITLYEMATGRVPFEHQTDFKLMSAHVNTDPPRPGEIYPGITPELEQIVLRAIQKDPAARYQTAAELHAALKALARQTGVSLKKAQAGLLASMSSVEAFAAPAPATPAPPSPRPAPTVVEDPKPAPAPTVVEDPRPAPAPTVVEARHDTVTAVPSTSRSTLIVTVCAGAAVLGLVLMAVFLVSGSEEPVADPVETASISVDEPPTRPEDPPEERPDPAAKGMPKPDPSPPAGKSDPVVEAKTGPQPDLSYTARLSARDHRNSRGQPLVNAASIVRQDRANFHRFGLRDDEDQYDPRFASKSARSRLARALRRMPRDVVQQIKQGTPLVQVQVWSDRVTVTVVSP